MKKSNLTLLQAITALDNLLFFDMVSISQIPEIMQEDFESFLREQKQHVTNFTTKPIFQLWYYKIRYSKGFDYPIQWLHGIDAEIGDLEKRLNEPKQ